MSRGMFSVLAVFVLVALLPGCGDDGSGGPGIEFLRITDVFPQDGAEDVNLNTPIYVWFSSDLETASLDSITISGTVPYHIEYDQAEKRAAVRLDSILSPNTAYQVRISSYVIDRRGNNLQGDSLFGFTTGPLDCAHIEDAFEPNDNAASAVEIDLDTTYALLSSCGGDQRQDFFRFTLTDTAKVTIQTDCIYADTAEVGWHMYFERSDGDPYAGIGTALGPAHPDHTHRHSFLPGTYYVHLWKYYVDDHLLVYNLRLMTSEPCPDDGFEDNDFIDEAAPVSPGSIENLRGCYLDPDFYSVNVQAGQTLTVTATEATSLGGHRVLNIYNPDGTLVAGHVSDDNPVVQSWTATVGGTCYFQVLWTVDGLVYNLDVEVTGP